jgi:hypothetical protein
MAEQITEKSKVSLPLQIFISVLVSLSIGITFIYGSYSGLSVADKDLQKAVDSKVDKTEFQRYTYTDSMDTKQFQREIRKDLLQIKRKLKIDPND